MQLKGCISYVEQGRIGRPDSTPWVLVQRVSAKIGLLVRARKR